MKKTPKIHEAISASESPPREPAVRMIARGAVAANSQPMNPFEAYSRPKSEVICPGVGGLLRDVDDRQHPLEKNTARLCGQEIEGSFDERVDQF
jgi:hypothetical protein